MKKYKVNGADVFEDNNDGYMYGVEWYDDNDNFLDIQWFKTEQERDTFFDNLGKKAIKRVGIIKVNLKYEIPDGEDATEFLENVELPGEYVEDSFEIVKIVEKEGE